MNIEYQSVGQHLSDVIKAKTIFKDDSPVMQHLAGALNLKLVISPNIFANVEIDLYHDLNRVYRFIREHLADFGIGDEIIFRLTAWRDMTIDQYNEYARGDRIWSNSVANLNNGTVARFMIPEPDLRQFFNLELT